MPKFRIRTLMIAVAIIATSLIEAKLTTLLLILAACVLRFGPSVDPSASDGPFPYFVTLACLYLPFAWVILDYPWDSYRWGWVKMWPILPGLFAGMFVHPNDSAEMWISGATSILLVAVFTKIGSLSRVALIVANSFALVGSGVISWGAHNLFWS